MTTRDRPQDVRIPMTLIESARQDGQRAAEANQRHGIVAPLPLDPRSPYGAAWLDRYRLAQ